MRRRAYLGAVASWTGLAAGCLSGDAGTDEQTTTADTATPTDAPTTTTPTETPTETPAPALPRIDFAGPVWYSSGEQVDDLSSRAVDAIGKGAAMIVGVETEFPVHAGRMSVSGAIEVYDASGTSVAEKTFERTQESPSPESIEWNIVVGIDASTYQKGSYEVEVRLRDAHDGTAADPTRFSFDVVDPFEPHEVSLVDYEPKQATAGESVTWRLTFRNESDRDSSVVSDVTATTNVTTTEQTVGGVNLELPASETVTHLISDTTLSDQVTYEFTLPAVDVSWKTEVT